MRNDSKNELHTLDKFLVWENFALHRGFHPALLAYLQSFPNKLIDTTPRAWSRFAEIIGLYEDTKGRPLNHVELCSYIGALGDKPDVFFIKVYPELIPVTADVTAILAGAVKAHNQQDSVAAFMTKTYALALALNRLRKSNDEQLTQKTIRAIEFVERNYTIELLIKLIRMLKELGVSVPSEVIELPKMKRLVESTSILDTMPT